MMMALTVLCAPCLILLGFMHDIDVIVWSGASFSPLSGSCMVLLTFSDPANKRGERVLLPFYVLCTLISAGPMIGRLDLGDMGGNRTGFS
mmetsp:Transcript_15678/g.31203  ORF Transcript_15678/g.31203 Transcript_15678/m.31203 type:complete len:90 (+) Transcript_15678:316-585(+)